MSGTVLMVDPESRTRHCLVARLEQSGYRVLEAAGVDDAIQAVLDRPPEVALLDLTTLEGLSLLLIRSIRRIQPRTRIILITGRDQIQLAIQGMKLGATSDVSAPLDVDVLLREVEAAVERFHEEHRSEAPEPLQGS